MTDRPMSALSSRSLARTGAIIVGAQALAALGGVATLRLLTELASPEVYGEAGLVLTALALCLQVGVSPVTSTQVRFHADAATRGVEDAFTDAVLRRALRAATWLIVSSLVVFLAAAAAGIVSPSPLLVAASIAWIAVNTVRNVVFGRVQAARQPLRYAVAQVVEVLLIGIASVAALRGLHDAGAIVLGQAVGVATVTLGLRRWWPRRAEPAAAVREAGALDGRVRSYGRAFVPLSVLNWAATLADRYLVAALLGAAAAGLYAAPAALATRGMALGTTALGDLLRPSLFAAVSGGDTAGGARILRQWVVASLGLGIVALLAVALCGDLAARWLLAAEYRADARGVLLWSVAGAGLLGISQALETGLLALNRSSDLLPPMVVGVCVLGIVGLVLVPRHGIVGAGAAASAGFAARTALVAALLAWRHRRVARPVVVEG